MRLIDADALMKRLKEDPLYPLVKRFNIDGFINAEPTVDAVPVVRCKDCKYWRDTDHTCREHSLVSPMTADDFCSKGERKDGDNETD